MRSSTPQLKNILAHAVLALAFLFAQQTASLHWLSHSIDATHAKAGTGSIPSEHCDECLTLSALDATAASGSFSLSVVTAQPALTASPVATAAPTLLRLAFRSRAPPSLI